MLLLRHIHWTPHKFKKNNSFVGEKTIILELVSKAQQDFRKKRKGRGMRQKDDNGRFSKKNWPLTRPEACVPSTLIHVGHQEDRSLPTRDFTRLPDISTNQTLILFKLLTTGPGFVLASLPRHVCILLMTEALSRTIALPVCCPESRCCISELYTLTQLFS